MAISTRQPACYLLFLTRGKLTFKKYTDAHEGKRAFTALEKAGRKPIVTSPTDQHGHLNGDKIRYMTTGEELYGSWWHHAVIMEGPLMGTPVLTGAKFADDPKAVDALRRAALEA